MLLTEDDVFLKCLHSQERGLFVVILGSTICRALMFFSELLPLDGWLSAATSELPMLRGRGINGCCDEEGMAGLK